MRILVILSCLLPLTLRAQLFDKFEPGSYVLASQPSVVLAGQLRLNDYGRLLVRDPAGTTQRLTPHQLIAFRIGKNSYLSVINFHVPNAIGGFDVPEGFAQRLDSGRVLLMRYTYPIGTTASKTIYLLQQAGKPEITAVQESVKRVQEALRPYLADRPDLLKQLDEKRLTNDFLPAVIHALNRNLPYTSPLPAR